MMMLPLLVAVFLPATAYGAAIDYVTVGCFGDRSDRAIATLEGQDANLDGNYQARVDAINKCAQAASSRGFTVFAVQHGGWCASSATAEDTYDKYGPSSACNADGEGGPWANQVYFIKDTEPPTCSSCPADIIIQDATTAPMRVDWNVPTCSDNSGLPVTVVSNRASGDLLDVPGSYTVLYQVTDAAGNTYDGCFFRITIKKKTCPLYPPPQNGALTCNKIGDDLTCMAMCKTGYDFVFSPPVPYFCSLGKWNFFSIAPYDATLPWPDCSGNAPPSLQRTLFPQLFFDANNPNVQDELRKNFISLMTSFYVPSFFCKDRPSDCNENTVLVYLDQE